MTVPSQDPVGLVWVHESVIRKTVAVLQASGDPHDPHEGIVYWAGRRLAGEAVVTTCIAPAARTTRASFETSSLTNAKVVMYLATAGLELIGQVHSHPGEFIDHSKGDDRRALMPYPGFLSVVVPSYARGGMLPLTICGVHAFQDSKFRRLSGSEIDARFRIVPEFGDLRNP